MSKNYIPKAIIYELIELSNGCCEYCKLLEEYCSGFFNSDHIIPLALGGLNELTNLARSCTHCNGRKYIHTKALDPLSGKIVALFNPRKENWNDHFQWSKDLLIIEGKTPIGRATIIRLDMNRQKAINLRKVTMGRGHPPE